MIRHLSMAATPRQDKSQESFLEDRPRDGVLIKGINDHLVVDICETCAEEDIAEMINKAFSKQKSFFKNADVILQTGKRTIDESSYQHIRRMLKEEFAVRSVTQCSIMTEDDGVFSPTCYRAALSAARPPRAGLIPSSEPLRAEDKPSLVHKGRLRSGQTVEAEGHLVQIGDVHTGAMITAGGDIFVLGALKGSAFAGVGTGREALVFSLDMRPTILRIGDVLASGYGGQDKKMYGPEVAKVDNGVIVIQALSRAFEGQLAEFVPKGENR
ncbi:MAG: hypothetical protein HQK58_16300 [Deltaproteobacteria bacterium]|nr:hypothetical protein [Deltaproteobacteria bacterium]